MQRPADQPSRNAKKLIAALQQEVKLQKGTKQGSALAALCKEMEMATIKLQESQSNTILLSSPKNEVVHQQHSRRKRSTKKKKAKTQANQELLQPIPSTEESLPLPIGQLVLAIQQERDSVHYVAQAQNDAKREVPPLLQVAKLFPALQQERDRFDYFASMQDDGKRKELNHFNIVGVIRLPKIIQRILPHLRGGYAVGSQIRKRLKGEYGRYLKRVDFDLVAQGPPPDEEVMIIAGEKFIRNPNRRRLFQHHRLKIEIFFSEKLAISLLEDAKARDFTINTFYANQYGHVFAPIKIALEHLRANLVVTIHPWYESYLHYPGFLIKKMQMCAEGGASLQLPCEIQYVLHALYDESKISREEIYHKFAKLFMRGLAVKSLEQLVYFGIYQTIFGCIQPDLLNWVKEKLAKVDWRYQENLPISRSRVFSIFVAAFILDEIKSNMLSYEAILDATHEYACLKYYADMAMRAMGYPKDLMASILGLYSENNLSPCTDYLNIMVTDIQQYQKKSAVVAVHYATLFFQSVALSDKVEEAINNADHLPRFA